LFISEVNQQRNSAEENEFRKASMDLLSILTKKGKVHMFLYIIEAANLAQKDILSNSDPYLVVKAGKQKQSFEKEYFEDEPNPQFFKKVHMVLEFPTDSTIDIEVWDYDPITADELIGTVSLDIEDRIDSKLTDVRFNNPIETHNLFHETSKRPQGLIRFWVDLVPIENISLYR
jgi:Ca2+-dependent lipid-binding protein